MATDELQSIMQRDGRTHDRKTQEAIRLIAVERIREGEDVASVVNADKKLTPFLLLSPK